LLLELLGYRRRRYRGDGFSVQIKSKVREGISVIYKRHGVTLDLRGERTGKGWKGIQVSIPREIETAEACQIASDVETALRGMDYEYVIVRGPETLAKSK